VTSSPARKPFSVVGISGSVRRPAKTTALIRTVLKKIEAAYGAPGVLFDLIDAPELGAAIDHTGIAGDLAVLIHAIESADVLVIGSPVYKGSYTGLFKHLFDLIGHDRLIGKPVILTASGGGDRHALVVEHQLRPLFGFFTAHSMATAIYASDADFVEGRLTSAATLKRIDSAVAELAPWFAQHTAQPALAAGDKE
jgi:FMN reductase